MISILITTREIPLTRGMVAIVDSEDYEWLSQFKWTFATNGYAFRRRNMGQDGYNVGDNVLMHREIMQAPRYMQVDHINGNRLNNSRQNLRLCTHHQNNTNRAPTGCGTSKYKGVSFDTQTQKWRATITANRNMINLGRFPNEIDAAQAYNLAAVQYHGEFARLNIV